MGDSTLEKISTKAHVGAKDIKADVKGLSGVFKVLMEEHGEASALLKHLKSQSDVGERLKTWAKVKPALLSHEKGELAVLYPELANYAQTASIAAAHNEQADEMEVAIKTLDRVGPGSAEWPTLLDELIALVQAHVEAEEGHYFKAALEVIGEDRAEAMKGEFLRAKAAVPGSLS